MDIKITHSSLKKFLVTDAPAEDIASKVSLCGPTFDRITKVEDDYLFEIEAITNRVDSASVQGIARESAAILTQFGIEAKMINDPYKDHIDLHQELPENFKIDVADASLTPRFSAISLKNVTIVPSSKQTSDFLNLCGLRPINNVVDITNELTILYGMPCHIFDLDKIAGKYLFIRESKPQESVITLDGETCRLKGKDIVIEDGEHRLIDLCGVMGGQLAEVDQNTKNILLIVPTYLPSKIRKTSLYLQKRTLASQIYEKQPDPELCLPVLNTAVKLFGERAGATPSSKVFDYYPHPNEPKLVSIDLKWLDKFVGIPLERSKVTDILKDLGFSTKVDGDLLTCTVPSSRYFDINIREDIAEEVTRIYGYFKLPSVIPCVNLPVSTQNPIYKMELKAKKYLSNIGFSEIYNNSLISLDLIQKTQQDKEEHLRLTNALSSDYEYLRTSLLPSLLNSLKNNQNRVDDNLNIYELSNIYLKRTKGKLPDEIPTLGIVTTKNYREAKGILESLMEYLNTESYTFQPSETKNQLYNRRNTADIYIHDQLIGHIGQVNPKILRELAIEKAPTVIELNFLKVASLIKPGYTYHPISIYPEVREDMTIKSNLLIGELISKIKNQSDLIASVDYLSSFENNHTFKISFISQTGNLDQKSVNEIKEKILSSLG